MGLETCLVLSPQDLFSPSHSVLSGTESLGRLGQVQSLVVGKTTVRLKAFPISPLEARYKPCATTSFAIGNACDKLPSGFCLCIPDLCAVALRPIAELEISPA